MINIVDNGKYDSYNDFRLTINKLSETLKQVL